MTTTPRLEAAASRAGIPTLQLGSPEPSECIITPSGVNDSDFVKSLIAALDAARQQAADAADLREQWERHRRSLQEWHEHRRNIKAQKMHRLTKLLISRQTIELHESPDLIWQRS